MEIKHQDEGETLSTLHKGTLRASAGPGHRRQALAPAPWKKVTGLDGLFGHIGLIHGALNTVVLLSRLGKPLLLDSILGV